MHIESGWSEYNFELNAPAYKFYILLGRQLWIWRSFVFWSTHFPPSSLGFFSNVFALCWQQWDLAFYNFLTIPPSVWPVLLKGSWRLMNCSVFCSWHFKLEIKNIFFNLKCSFFSFFLKVESWCLDDHVGLLGPAQTQLTLCLIQILNIFLVSLTTKTFMWCDVWPLSNDVFSSLYGEII